MTVVCFRTGIGPECEDSRLERSKARTEDCLTTARFACLIQSYNQLTDLFKNLSQKKGKDDTGEQCLMPFCLNVLETIVGHGDNCRREMAKCWCDGGISCKECDDGDNADPQDPEAPPTTERTSADRLKGLGVTNSCWGCPIPLPFGTVKLPGNIIWVGNAIKEEVTIRTVTGDEADTHTQEYGFIDMAVGLCVGEIEAVSRVWIGETLVVNNSIVIGDEDESSLNRAIYDLDTQVDLLTGSAAQSAYKTMVDVDGFGRSPGYRDLAVLFFKRFPVFTSSTTIPSISVEVIVRRDRTVSVVDTSNVGPLDSGLLEIEDVARRAYVSDGTDILVLDLESLAQRGTIAADNVIDPDTVVLTKGGDLMYHDDGYFHHVNGASPTDRWKSNALETGPFCAMEVQDRFSHLVTPIMIQDGAFIRVWQSQPETADFAEVVDLDLDASYANSTLQTGDLEFLTVCDVAPPNMQSANKVAFGFFHNTVDGSYVMAQWVLSCSEQFLAFNADMPMKYAYFDIDMMPPTGTLCGHVFDDRMGQSIFFFDNNVAAIWDWDSNNSVVNTFSCPVPTGFRNRKRGGITKEYKYIADGAVHQIDLRAKTYKRIEALSFWDAPDIGGTQWYDPSKNMIAYIDTDGEISKLYLSRYVGELATVADVATGVLLRVGLEAKDIDVSAVTGLTMNGFLVSDQANAGVVIQELCDFFQVTAMDVNGKITLRPRASGSTITLDEDEEINDKVERDVVTEKNVWAAKVQYYDVDRDSAVFTQSIGRDVFTDDVDYVSNIEEQAYAVAVFTNADLARRSVERYLLRLIQREDSLELYVAQANFAIEPSDFVTFEGNKYRVRKVENDPSWVNKITATTDDPSIYEAVSALSGVTIDNVVDHTVQDFDAPVRNVPVSFNMQFLGEDPTQEYIYTGLLNPDSSPVFAATEVSGRDLRGGRTPGDTPTGKAIVGRLTVPPASVTPEFTTDRVSSMQIIFDEAVPGGVLNNVAVSTLWETYDTNVVYVGREIIQYGNAVIGMDGRTVTFTNLLRARFSTDKYMHTHAAGQRCMLYHAPRMIQIPLTQVSTDYRIGVGTTYDTRNALVFRDGPVEVIDHRAEALQAVGLRMYKEATNLHLRLAGRRPFSNPLVNSAEETENVWTNSEGTPFLAWLTAPFDVDTFEEEWALGHWPVNGEIDSVYDDARYIRVVALNMQNYDVTLDHNFYKQAGHAITEPLYFCLGTCVPEDLALTNTEGWVFDGHAHYTHFRSGRQT